MAQLLFTADASFPAQFAALLKGRGQHLTNVGAAVMPILEDVRARGFDAVAEYTNKFDQFSLSADNFQISPAKLNAAYDRCDKNVIASLEFAAERILTYHQRAIPQDGDNTDEFGVRTGWRWRPVDAAGLYAPGGLAAYPSSVLMNALPARAAGVSRLVMVTPPARMDDNPAILAAAKIAGVDEIYAMGGAQAIGALAYGAGPCLPVDVIVGPGNAYVAAAKKSVFGDVGIDSIAGPSEVYVVADRANDAETIAADMLAQAEHDELAQSILFTDDEAFGRAVMVAIERQIGAGEAGPPAKASWADYGAVIIATHLDEAVALINQGAPEHLQLAFEGADDFAEKIRHAGAIFLGPLTAEALGDYVAGPNHVLPTDGRARWASGLSTHHFMKRTTFLGVNQMGLNHIGPHAVTLAMAEGLAAHGHSVARRLKK